MAPDRRFAGTGWSTVGLVGLVLVGGSLLPLPFRRRPEFGRFGPDKALHFLGYFGLAAAVADALADEGVVPLRSALLAVCCATGVGVGTGALQRYVPGRANERADLVAGVLGAALGALCWYPGPEDSTNPERRWASPEPSDRR